MKKEEAHAKLNEVLRKGDGWKCVECVADANGNIFPVTLHNIIFKKDELCVLRLAAGGYGFDIHIKPTEAGTLDFGISCMISNDWFSSEDLSEIIDFMNEWFVEHKKSK